MSSNGKYGLNFGFRRSDESMAVREGRLRTPASGTFRIGSLVEFDPAAVGYLKVAAANAVGEGGTCGILVQDEQFIRSIFQSGDVGLDSSGFGIAKNNTLSTIWSGPGVKVWMRNTPARTLSDGRSIAAVTMFTATGVLIGDYLTWDGSKYVEGTAANSMLRVTAIDTTATATSLAYVEAVLTR